MEKFLKGQIVGWDGKNYRFLGGENKKENWEIVDPVSLPTMEQSMQQELAGRGAIDKFLGGAGAAMDKAAYGAKALFTGLEKPETERLALNKQVTQTPPGMLGQVAGDVAMSAAPGMATSKLASMAPSVMSRLLADVGGNALVGGGYGALVTPESRRTGALLGGLGGGAGALTGNLLSGIAKPAAGTAAEELQKRGIPLTVGQSAGGITKRIEDAMRGTASNIAGRQADALEAWSQGVVQKAAPAGAQVTGTGRNAIAEASSAFDDAYDNAFSQMGKLAPDATLTKKLGDVVSTYSPKLIKSDADTLAEQVNRVGAEMAGGLDGRAMKDLRRSYQVLADKAFGDGNARLGQAYKATISALDDLASRQYPKASQALKDIDSQYGQFNPVQRAAGKLGAEEGVFSPAQLLGALRETDKSTGKNLFAKGKARGVLMEEAEKAKRVLGATIPPMGPGTAEKLAIPLAAQNLVTLMPALAAQGLYNRSIQGVLTGQYPWQQFINPGLLGSIGASLGLRRK